MARTRKSIRVDRQVTNRKARAAIEQAVLALQKRNEKEAEERTARLVSRSADMAAIMEPIGRLLTTNPSSELPLSRMRQHQKARVRRLGRTGMTKVRRLSSGATMPLTLILQENLTFQFPPYDYQWQWGNIKQRADFPAAKSDSSLGEGSFNLYGGSWGVMGSDTAPMAGGSGIGFRLISDKPGSVVIAPLIQYYWSYDIDSSGVGPWTDTRGGIDISAWEGSSLVANRRPQIFQGHVEAWGTTWQELDGYVWPPDVTISFPIAASTWYAVSIGGWLECDHCSIVGQADGFGQLDGHVRWATVQLWTE